MRAVLIGKLDAGQLAVTVAAAKQDLGVEHARTDEVIRTNILAAEEYIEEQCEMALTAKRYTLYADSFAEYVDLYPYNAIAIESVKYTNASGVAVTMPDTEYSLYRAMPCSVVFSYIPAIKEGSKVEITYTAGYSEVPALLQRATLMLVSSWYDNAGDVVIGRLVSEMPLNVERLISTYKLMRVV